MSQRNALPDTPSPSAAPRQKSTHDRQADALGAIDAAIWADSDASIAAAGQRLADMEEQIRLRKQLVLVQQVWRCAQRNPWVLEVEAEMNTSGTRAHVQPESGLQIDEAALAVFMQGPRGAETEQEAKQRARLAEDAKNNDCEVETSARYEIVDELEALDWSSLSWKNNEPFGAEMRVVNFSTRDALAKSLLPPPALALWEALSIQAVAVARAGANADEKGGPDANGSQAPKRRGAKTRL